MKVWKKQVALLWASGDQKDELLLVPFWALALLQAVGWGSGVGPLGKTTSKQGVPSKHLSSPQQRPLWGLRVLKHTWDMSVNKVDTVLCSQGVPYSLRRPAMGSIHRNSRQEVRKCNGLRKINPVGLGDRLWFSLGGTVDSLRRQSGSKDLKEVRVTGGRIYQAKGMNGQCKG